jgi:hypothetical protein
VQGDGNARRKAVHGFVDGVVEHFPDQVVQSRRADAADVHAGALPDGLETLQNGDVFGCVVGHCLKGYRLQVTGDRGQGAGTGKQVTGKAHSPITYNLSPVTYVLPLSPPAEGTRSMRSHV